jgi:signal peptidase I
VSTAPAEGTERPRPRGGWRASLAQVVVVLALGVLTAVFVVTTVGIDGVSMAPTLSDGDRALVPRFETWWHRRTATTWSSGDVVYFRPPGSDARGWVDRLTGGPFLIKRVVAVGGETVALERGRLLVDGVRVPEPYLEGTPVTVASMAPVPVPAGTVFVLGDNRAPLASRDSRAFGPVPIERVAGRAAWVVWPWWRQGDDGLWRWNVHRL